MGYNDDMNSKTAKIYKVISIVILGLCIYGFLLPLISPLMEKMLPHIWTCPFLRITGRPCPFCGITSGVSSLYRMNFNSASILSMIVFFLALVETAFRIMVIMTVSGLKQKTVSGLIIVDLVYHTLLVGLTAFYVIMFLVIKF